MGYLSVWKAQEKMIADFRKRGMEIPDRIVNDLKSTLALINIPRTSLASEEAFQRIELNLTQIESYLVIQGEKQFGTEYVDLWLRRLNKARKRISEEEERDEARFVPGVPRERRWIRVKPSHRLPFKKLEELAEASKVTCRMQSDGLLLVYGKDEHLKDFVKKMTSSFKQAKV